MAAERTCTQIVPKPWGTTDLRPWNSHHGAAIGEIWFQRIDAAAPGPALLVKLLFTNAPLSIQVHPDDAYARSIGLAQGKSEAWYVLSATADAKIALGLKRRLIPEQLRAAIDDGSISELIQWRTVTVGDAIFVAPGAIHAIGPGLVIVEVQQRSEATFRLFDFGRHRPLHADDAVAVACRGQAADQVPARELSDVRTLLVTSPHFVLEHVEFPAQSAWELLAATETWLFVLDGRARIGTVDAGKGETLFLGVGGTHLQVGLEGLKGLLAYVGSDPVVNLLRRLSDADVRLSQAPA